MADLSEGPVCPVPLPHQDKIILGHGSGGQLSQQLIEKVFHGPFANPFLDQGDDSALIPIDPAAGSLAFTTDSHIVTPLFFPGGDIGRLAVCGTVNDLAMIGAFPTHLTAGFILEEGLEISVLEQIVHSMAAAHEAGVMIAAGDTKVVEKGKADRVFINTSGIGFIPAGQKRISGSQAKPGDTVILSGSIGDHGIAVLAARNDLAFEIQVESDVAPLNHITRALLTGGMDIHVMRDPTRGGLGTTLNEIACQSQVSIHLDETSIPIKLHVLAACEMLGFDPLYVANEGKMVIIAHPDHADEIIKILRSYLHGQDAARIGSVEETDPGRVVLHTAYGSSRLVPMLTGELLPRIC
jgi:hydrogenase expression/formation protein HypE